MTDLFKYSLCLCGIVLSLGLSAQQKLSLYYRINEVSSEKNFSRVDSFVKSLKNKKIEVSIAGYADYLSSGDYNLKLSESRAKAVKKYFAEKYSGQVVVKELEGKGEKFSKENSSTDGEADQRRVDVVILSGTKTKTPEIKAVAKSVQSKKTSDTLTTAESIDELEKGESMALKGLSFYPGRHTLLPSAEPILKELLEILMAQPTLRIEIQGHICCVEPGEDDAKDFDSNDRFLSRNRAKAVYDFLIRNGVAKDRLRYKGYGHRKPLVKNETTPEEEQMNRRVEIMVLEN